MTLKCNSYRLTKPYLTTHPGRLVTAAELRKAVWPDTYVSEGLLRSYIREVRQVLGDDAEVPRFIETIPCRRYRFLAKGVSSQQSVVSGTTVVSGQSSVISPPLTLPLRSQLATGDRPLASRVVSRDIELTQLHRWLVKALNGMRQVVFVTGELGIEKTRVARHLFVRRGESERVRR